MNAPDLKRENENQEATSLLYRAAFDRLTFQDDYLFKFSTLFLTAHGALAVFAQWLITRSESWRYPGLALACGFGVFLGLVWCSWTSQNDYWHSVWKGALIDIEKNKLATTARVFAANHEDLARGGGRSRPCLRGHSLALFLPSGVTAAWVIALIVSALWWKCGT